MEQVQAVERGGSRPVQWMRTARDFLVSVRGRQDSNLESWFWRPVV